MNRAEATRQVLLLEAAAAQLKERARAVRSELEQAARAEHDEHGGGITWRYDIGSWSLPISKEAPTVTDGAALTSWVKDRWPDEIVDIINPAFQAKLMTWLEAEGDVVVYPPTGEIVPGLGVLPAGVQTLRFRAASDAKAVADQQAELLVKQVAAGLGIGDA